MLDENLSGRLRVFFFFDFSFGIGFYIRVGRRPRMEIVPVCLGL